MSYDEHYPPIDTPASRRAEWERKLRAGVEQFVLFPSEEALKDVASLARGYQTAWMRDVKARAT